MYSLVNSTKRGFGKFRAAMATLCLMAFAALPSFAQDAAPSAVAGLDTLANRIGQVSDKINTVIAPAMLTLVVVLTVLVLVIRIAKKPRSAS